MTLVMVPGSSQDLLHPSSPAFNPSLTCHEILGICEGIASPVSANHALDHQLLEELGVTPVNGPHFGISRLPCGQSNTGLDLGRRPTHHFRSITTAFLQQDACLPRREKMPYSPQISAVPAFLTSCATRAPETPPFLLVANSKPLVSNVTVLFHKSPNVKSTEPSEDAKQSLRGYKSELALA